MNNWMAYISSCCFESSKIQLITKLKMRRSRVQFKDHNVLNQWCQAYHYKILSFSFMMRLNISRQTVIQKKTTIMKMIVTLTKALLTKNSQHLPLFLVSLYILFLNFSRSFLEANLKKIIRDLVTYQSCGRKEI